ncbi:hypothetical protein ACIO3O_27710 [Streptomyces sp. NPDC087440]|uniref:hypothetical protein n=1 Tax=Streptomyces sp. NPDC087440 TaxID=3365790 RepID=UPI0038040FB3
MSDEGEKVTYADLNPGDLVLRRRITSHNEYTSVIKDVKDMPEGWALREYGVEVPMREVWFDGRATPDVMDARAFITRLRRGDQ